MRCSPTTDTIRTGSSRLAAAAIALLAVAAIPLFVAGAMAGREPFATWLYPMAWFPTLLLLDAAVALRDGRFFLLGRSGFLATAFAWSIPFWLVFELLNLRLENWYYVFLPREPAVRWMGIALSFSTVIPAVLVAERLLDSLGFARAARLPPIRLSGRLAAILQATGVVMLLLPLAWPRIFFPLVWGGVLLLVDPWVRARDPGRSLLADLERGRPGRIARLLAGGLGIGFIWEAFNAVARGKWIYTVPGLDGLRPFEMPALGFLGFPFFALEAFAVWQALVVAGLAVPREGRPRSARLVAVVATGVFALTFSAVTIAAMHRETISSLAPTLSGVGAAPEVLARADIDDPAELAAAEPRAVSAATGVGEDRARAWVERARIATLGGIGAANAAWLGQVDVGTVEDLAAADPGRLAERLAMAGAPARPARVRVWVRSAREATERAATRPSS